MTRLLCIADFHYGTRKCPGLEWLASCVASTAPDVLVIAGDLFDKKAEPNTSVSSFLETLDIPVVLIWGNHDATCDAPSWFQAPANVYFPTFAGIQVPGVELVFHGCHVVEKRDNRMVAGAFPVAHCAGHIGVFHTSLTGEWSKNPCLPSTLPELESRNYEAWILGHVHLAIEPTPGIFWPGIGKYRVLEV